MVVKEPLHNESTDENSVNLDSDRSMILPSGFFQIETEVDAWNKAMWADRRKSVVRGDLNSPSISIVNNSYILPRIDFSALMEKDSKRISTESYAVYDSTGKFVPNAIHIGRDSSVKSALLGPKDGFQKLSGRWLFAGLALPHLGHFLTECIGRLWATSWLTHDIDGVIYCTRAIVKATDGMGFLDDGNSRVMARHLERYSEGVALKVFGSPRRVHLVQAPIVVEQLIVPSQLTALNMQFIGGNALFVEHVRSCIDRIVPPLDAMPKKKIYISRRYLAPNKSKFACEELLEEALKTQGYEIVYPERINLEEQFRIYRNASHIILAVGSACHVLSLALNRTQQIMLLHRCKGSFGIFVKQMCDFGALSVLEVDALAGYLRCTPKDEKKSLPFPRTEMRALSEATHLLDFKKLWIRLAEQGFVKDAFPASVEGKLREHLEVCCQNLGEALKSEIECVYF